MVRKAKYHEESLDDIVTVRTVTRSISLPIAECTSMEWKEFMQLLHGCWRHSTDLANWARHSLVRLDVTRTPGMKELPPMPNMDLYALAFGRVKERPARKEGKGILPVVPQEYDAADFWGGAKIAAATLLRKVQSKYSKERGKIIWRRERRAPEFLYPYPFPVHQQSWAIYFNERSQPIVSMALPGGQRVAIRLRQGDEFRPQLRILRMIEAGDIKQQEISICRQRSYTNSGEGHYRTGADKMKGSSKVSYRIMLRIACRVPVCPLPDSEITGTAKTGTKPFLTLTIGDRQPWYLHGDEALGWIVAHRRFLDRMAEDMKYEKRWPRKKRARMLGRVQRGCDKHHRRMKTFLQKTAHMMVSYAQRNLCARLQWDDSDRTFVNRDFPWFEFAEVVKNKCDELGLVFDPVTSGRVLETDVPDDSTTSPNGATV